MKLDILHYGRNTGLGYLNTGPIIAILSRTNPIPCTDNYFFMIQSSIFHFLVNAFTDINSMSCYEHLYSWHVEDRKGGRERKNIKNVSQRLISNIIND